MFADRDWWRELRDAFIARHIDIDGGTEMKRPSPFEQWFLIPERRPGALLRLICVPYAGGGPGAYHGWARELGPAVEPWLLRLPGRESRVREQPLTSVNEIVEQAVGACAAELCAPFAVFGYSVGAWIAFELARTLRDGCGLRAAHLGVAARPAPHVPLRHKPVHTLPDDAFLDAIDQRFKAIPPEIRDSWEMTALYLPMLRADTTAFETYRYRPGAPLDCAIAAFGGIDDIDCPESELREWRHHTTAGFRATLLPGGHFFLRRQQRTLIAQLRQDLFDSAIP